MTPTRFRRGAVLAIALVAVVALPAGAHPYVHGGQAPADSLATITLDLAHGCDSEEAGAGQDTTEVALQVPDWLRIVEVPEPAGWTVELETSADGTLVEVVTWTTDDPQEPAPTFDLDVVATGEPGEQRYLGVFQACDGTAYRWVGTPDEPADDPAVRLTIGDPDPDAPPPPEPEPEPEPGEEETEAEEREPDVAAGEDAGAGDPEATTGDDTPVSDETAPDDSDADTAADDAGDTAAAAAADDGGGLGWGVILAPLVAVAVAAFVALRRRRAAEG